MQPDSRPESALEVKSSTQALKQLSTRLPKTFMKSLTWRFCRRASSSRDSDAVRLGGGGVLVLEGVGLRVGV